MNETLPGLRLLAGALARHRAARALDDLANLTVILGVALGGGAAAERAWRERLEQLQRMLD